MDHIKRNFYREFYLKTGGFIPMSPLSRSIALGDFFQIRNGEIIPLGNIFTLRLIENIVISEPARLSLDDWKLSSGARQIFYAAEQIMEERGERGQRTKRILEFEEKGSFIFHGTKPEIQSILNWSDFQDDLTIKLTQSQFSFREAYVVVDVANVSSCGLSLAGKAGARMEMFSAARDIDFFDLMTHDSVQLEQCSDIYSFETQKEKTTSFFKSRKLVMKERKKEELTRLALEKAGKAERDEFGVIPFFPSGWLETDLLNLTVSNELNIATALEFFTWADASLDDVEKLT